jgi:hypothetical protein
VIPRPTAHDLRRVREFLRPPGEPPLIRLLSFHPLTKGALCGFATIEIISCGLRMRDLPVLVGRNGAWANLSSKPQIDKDGRQKIGADGKPAYAAILEWRDRDLANRFSDAVVAAVRHQDPEALQGDAS